MTTVDGKLNAKQRRKLLREQQRQLENSDRAKRNDVAKHEQEQIQLKSIKQTLNPEQEPVVPVELKSASQDEHQNTKKWQRSAQPIKQFPDTESDLDDMNLNAQQRRLLKRKLNKVNGQTITKKQRNESETIGENVKSTGNCKSIHLTLFVGQLPFKTTEEMIRKHFAEAGEIKVRMLTDKKTKKFRGMAFIEVKDSKALGAALSRHHTLLLRRRINVELTASGGGNKSEIRRNKIDLLRQKQSTVQVKKTKALIQKHIDGQEYKLQQEDVDDRMIDFLSWFDYETAKKALDEYNCCVSDRVNNRKAFFMGILKRFRQTDGVE